MNKFKDITVIVSFLVIIFSPTIFYNLFRDYIKIENTENRELASKPDLTVKNYLTYSKDYESYYNDNLPFRTQLKKMWSSINADIFNISTNDSVMIGKDGWLFYTGDGTIEQLTGKLKFSDDEISNITTKFKNWQDKFEEKGIGFYLLILPNKENIYRKYLPDVIYKNNNISRTEKLYDALKDKDINIVYPKEQLQNSKYLSYYKHDTHWNKYGAYLGFCELQKMILENNYECKVSINRELVSTGDLKTMANLSGKYQTEMTYGIND